jgi:hypothetical protein
MTKLHKVGAALFRLFAGGLAVIGLLARRRKQKRLTQFA